MSSRQEPIFNLQVEILKRLHCGHNLGNIIIPDEHLHLVDGLAPMDMRNLFFQYSDDEQRTRLIRILTDANWEGVFSALSPTARTWFHNQSDELKAAVLPILPASARVELTRIR